MTPSERGTIHFEGEQWGDQEQLNTYKISDFDYNSTNNYPFGISANYTGTRLGRGEYPQIEVTVAKWRLLYEDESTRIDQWGHNSMQRAMPVGQLS